ncbi:hypothetical protein BD289DRAFT_485228 [Coniella lustricola]|uniref:Uncharacterized protein n=1 Tax=Coniella lustricola TaxID=2025994 RepID=A0A2T2ZZB7_9PEZI|nr:hypothetical protein BD289DRAFT_485228 [Coniella lustricola]
MGPAQGYTASFSFESAPSSAKSLDVDSYRVVLLYMSKGALVVDDDYEYDDDDGDGDDDDDDNNDNGNAEDCESFESDSASNDTSSSIVEHEHQEDPPILLCLHKSWGQAAPSVKPTLPFAIHIYRGDKGQAFVVGGDSVLRSRRRALVKAQGGLYSHLLSLCRQHAEQRNNPNDVYSVWTPTQHLELSEVQAWSVGSSVPVVRFLHELARAIETVGTSQEEDMALHGSSDPVKVSIRLVAASVGQLRYWIASFREGLVGRDYDLASMDDIVQGLDARQAYIVDWSVRHGLPCKELKVNESMMFPEKQSKEWRCAASVESLFNEQHLMDSFSTTRDTIHSSAKTLQRIMTQLESLNHTLTVWIHMAAASYSYLQVLDDAHGVEMPLITDTGTGSHSRPWNRRNHFNSKGNVLPLQAILTRLFAYYMPWLDQMLTRAVCIALEEPFYIAMCRVVSRFRRL